MPPKFTSRQLAYEAPPVPSFLQKLHSQVNQSRGNINDKRSGGRQEETSEFDSLLGIGPSTSNREGKSSRAKEDEEDEFDGAQIVVLKEGKHLSKEEAYRIGKLEKADEAILEEQGQGVIAGPQAAPSASSTAKRKQISSAGETRSSGLDDVKDLIKSSKQSYNDQNENEEIVKNKRKEEREKVKLEKNKRARIEKSKRGKGLSFDMDD